MRARPESCSKRCSRRDTIPQHGLHIGDRPHLYPLARLESQSPRYAAVVTDTNTAHILVFAAGELVTDREVKNVRTRDTSQGGWSQARYQRHLDNFHLQHVKEVVDALDRVVRDEDVAYIVDLVRRGDATPSA